MKLNIDNWRWAGVPFYFRPASVWRSVTRRSPSSSNALRFELFRKAPFHKPHTNTLVIQIQPVEAISLSFGAKIPGRCSASGIG